MTLPEAANAKFKIDDDQVEGFERQDTQHGIIPMGLTSRRVVYPPGGVQPFVLLGRARQNQIYCIGNLRTASFDAMRTLLETHRTWLDTTTTCKVTLDGNTYDPVAPLDFRTLKKFPVPFTDANQTTPGAKMPALFLFQILG